MKLVSFVKQFRILENNSLYLLAKCQLLFQLSNSSTLEQFTAAHQIYVRISLFFSAQHGERKRSDREDRCSLLRRKYHRQLHRSNPDQVLTQALLWLFYFLLVNSVSEGKKTEKGLKTLQSVMNTKLSQHRFWHAHQDDSNDILKPICEC